MSSSNVREKLWVALRALVTGGGSLQERLASAALGLATLPSKNGLREKHRAALEAIMQDLTRESAAGNEGRIQATTRRMSDQEAVRIAGEILDLYTEIKGGI